MQQQYPIVNLLLGAKYVRPQDAVLKVNEGFTPDILVQLRPTTPLRPFGLIERAIELIDQNKEYINKKAKFLNIGGEVLCHVW